MPTTPHLRRVYCPSCIRRLPLDNYGCPCGNEGDGVKGRIHPLLRIIANPGSYLNDVSPLFLRRLAQAAQNSPKLPKYDV